jgi:hypothetical protein
MIANTQTSISIHKLGVLQNNPSLANKEFKKYQMLQKTISEFVVHLT